TNAGAGDNDVVASGQTMAIDASQTATLDFNSSAETDGHFNITGSSFADTFRLGNLTSSTTINAGTGNDELVYIDPNGSSTTAGHLTEMNGLRSFETITIDDGNAAFKLSEAVVGNGDTLAVTHTWGSMDTYSMYVDVSEDTDGTFSFNAHKGDDTFIFGTNMSSSQTVNGGYFGGYIFDEDTLRYTDDGNSSNRDELDSVTNVENIILGAQASYITAVDALRANEVDTVTIDATSATTLDFNYQAETNEGGSYHVKGSSNADIVRAGSGKDTIEGNDGDDTFYFDNHLTNEDTVDGGAGNDTLYFTPVWDIVDNHENLRGVTNVERAILTEGNSILNMTDSTLTGTQVLEVDASGWTSTGLTFNGAAESTGGFLLKGGAAADTLIGGGGDDQFFGGNGADILKGNGGNDIFYYESTGQLGDTIQAFCHADDQLKFNENNFGTTLTFHSAGYSAGGYNNTGLSSVAQSFIFDTDNFKLWFDSDGTGTSDMGQLVATFTTGSDAVQADDIDLYGV
ncbi:MAG: hypothetical protein KKC99_10835, partial [Proteobacteria bacterium]|nr:hypothetical protein [Pseudomonadota bacterium]